MRKNGAPEKIDRGKKVVITSSGHIPFLAGRPSRDAAISRDDLTDLQIAIYTCKSMEDFLKIT